MGTILTRKKVLAFKIEATPGTPETLTAAEGTMVVTDVSFEPDINQFERNILTPTFSRFASLPGARSGVFKFKTEVKGGGAVDTPPAMGPLLRACGFGQTINASTDVTYDPISDSIPTVTMAVWNADDASSALRFTIAGAMGTVKFTGKFGEPLFAEFEFRGLYVVPADEAPISPTFDILAPPVLLGASFTVQGYAAKIESLSIDMGNAITLRSDISAAHGWANALFTGRQPTFSIDPEQSLVATHPWVANIVSGAEGVLSFSLGSSAGNQLAVTANKAQYTGLSEGDRNGLGTFSVDGRFNRNAAAGNDEIQLVFS